jgi:hypothetical protein
MKNGFYIFKKWRGQKRIQETTSDTCKNICRSLAHGSYRCPDVPSRGLLWWTLSLPTHSQKSPEMPCTVKSGRSRLSVILRLQKKKKKKNPITNCSMSKEQLRALASMVIKDGPAK